MRFNEPATERRSDGATKGLAPHPLSPGTRGERVRVRGCSCFSLRRSVARSLRRSPHAFSLVEIMIVVVIIGLLAGVVTYATTGYLERAKRQKARADISTLVGAVDSY